MEATSVLDRIIAEALKKPPIQRLAEIERLLETSKLTLPQIKRLHDELAQLKKRLPRR